ncbi:perilipin-2 [Gouania willdenowi]|uniref:Perilipin n=1 Tax=Gouania willdenowi TaxID=441366 RepID=A0A8C5I645_GOUWI|nr:perilipin-2 [Gouania willdenowi]
MAPVEVINSQNVVERVTGLPLISSTFTLVSNVYSSTKENHPYIRTVCEAAEQGLRTVTSVALTTASPIIHKLEPQISIANKMACKGLDRIESRLSILHQPSNQVVSQAKDVVTSTVSRVKGGVSGALTNVVEKTLDAAEDGMEKTRAVISGSVGAVLESRVVQVVSSGVDSALSTSENLLEQYLPVSEYQQELEADAVNGFDRRYPSYYIRLGSLSSKVRNRVYSRAVARIQDGRRRSMDFISTVDLTGYGRRNVNEANNKLSSLMRWKSPRVQSQENSHEAEVIESHTVTLSRTLTQKLQTTCLVLVSGIGAFPHHLSLSQSVTQVYTGFTKANVPDAVFTSSKVQLGKMKDSFHHVLDYLVNNTPLNWLIGPFYPSMPLDGAHAASASTKQPSTSQQHSDVEMESL